MKGRAREESSSRSTRTPSSSSFARSIRCNNPRQKLEGQKNAATSSQYEEALSNHYGFFESGGFAGGAPCALSRHEAGPPEALSRLEMPKDRATVRRNFRSNSITTPEGTSPT